MEPFKSLTIILIILYRTTYQDGVRYTAVLSRYSLREIIEVTHDRLVSQITRGSQLDEVGRFAQVLDMIESKEMFRCAVSQLDYAGVRVSAQGAAYLLTNLRREQAKPYPLQVMWCGWWL